jgi:hypothetical protein
MSKVIKVKLEFLEEALGTSNSNPDIHGEFIASKAPDAQSTEEEVAAIGVQAVIEKGKTIFPKENGQPYLWNYQVKGFFKDACSALRCADDTESADIKAFKKHIDGLVFVSPRKIMLHMPAGAVIGSCQRPLRGQTAQGERISLANSETVPVGTSCEFEIKLLKADMEPAIIEWLNYGADKGLLGWRNSGKGSFSYTIVE